jgi:hypothetical protein
MAWFVASLLLFIRVIFSCTYNRIAIVNDLESAAILNSCATSQASRPPLPRPPSNQIRVVFQNAPAPPFRNFEAIAHSKKTFNVLYSISLYLRGIGVPHRTRGARSSLRFTIRTLCINRLRERETFLITLLATTSTRQHSVYHMRMAYKDDMCRFTSDTKGHLGHAR